MSDFKKELETLINRHCCENGSDTPDFILAEYLQACLKALDAAVNVRETWYGKTKPDEAKAGYGYIGVNNPLYSHSMGAPYGLCPTCAAPGVERERRFNGNDVCRRGHVYPSSSAKSVGWVR